MKLNRRFYIILILALQTIIFAKTDSTRTKIEQIIQQAKGKVGVTIIDLKSGDTLSFNGNEHFPMQSVYKFPLALAMLNQVDKGKFTLDQKIHIKKEYLLPNTWSPLKEKYPQGNVDITLDELLSYTVSQSDNNGCDILFRLLGGPKVVNKYIHDIGIKDIAIVATEEEMHKEWSIQYNNWSTPTAMGKLLQKFYNGDILSKKSKDYLWQVMVNTSTGPGKIKGLLPEGTTVAHKTGSSGEDEKGIAAATNDAGIVSISADKNFVIVILVSESSAKEEDRDKVIAQIARTAWDSYSVK